MRKQKPKSKYALSECEVKNIEDKLLSKSELEKRAKIYHALSDPVRLKILSAVAIRPLCVCVLTEITKMNYSKLSYHLSILKENNLVNCREDGNWIIYNITEHGKKVIKLLQPL